MGMDKETELGDVTHCSNFSSNDQLNFPEVFSPDIGYLGHEFM